MPRRPNFLRVLKQVAPEGIAPHFRRNESIADLRLFETPAVHQSPVEIEPLLRCRIFERVACSDLFRCNQASYKARLLAIDQGVSTAVPSSIFALNEAKHGN